MIGWDTLVEAAERVSASNSGEDMGLIERDLARFTAQASAQIEADDTLQVSPVAAALLWGLSVGVVAQQIQELEDE